MRDASGDVIDTFGTKSKPFEFNIVGKTDAEPPAFPDRDAPARCAEEVECPPDFPGCKSGGGGTKGWGASCESTSECQGGLACVDGSCETAQSCDIDADCPSGKCKGGVCQSGEGPSGPFKKNWIGFHVAQDLAIVGGDDVCSQDSQNNNGFACFYEGTENQYNFDPQPARANKISTGMAPATTRIMLSFDRVLGKNLTLGARAGYALNGGPSAGDKKFLPFHGEVRIGYWFGKQPFAKKGIRPYVAGGGGIAQVDAKLPVTVVDCAQDPNTGASQVGTQAYTNCANDSGSGAILGKEQKLDAYKKMARKGCKIWMEHGALHYAECVADDVPHGKSTDFYRAVKCKEDETVIFAYIVYKSRASRDAVLKKVMADPRLHMDPKDMPFDGKRMFWGGFKTVVESK